MGVVSNFIFFLGVIAILAVLVRPSSKTGSVIDALAHLLSTSIDAAKG